MVTIEKLAVKWGLIIFAMLLGYFFIMKQFDLIHNIELRLLNGVFMFIGLYLGIKEAKKRLDEFSYFKGIGMGLLTALIASFLFAAFGFLYLTVLDPDFIIEIKNNEPFGQYINVYGASLQIFFEGAASGCGLTYAVMQRLKQPHMAGPVSHNA